MVKAPVHQRIDVADAPMNVQAFLLISDITLLFLCFKSMVDIVSFKTKQHDELCALSE